MSSHRPPPAFARDVNAHITPYGRAYSAFYVVYELAGLTHEEVIKPRSNQSIKQLMEQLGVGPNDWAADPLS